MCAGEKDKCVGESYLGERFIFVSFTGGEGSLPKGSQWQAARHALNGREVIVCYDADSAGHAGAQKVALSLVGVCKEISVVSWPQSLLEQAPTFTPPLAVTAPVAKHSARIERISRSATQEEPESTIAKFTWENKPGSLLRMGSLARKK